MSARTSIGTTIRIKHARWDLEYTVSWMETEETGVRGGLTCSSSGVRGLDLGMDGRMMEWMHGGMSG